MKMNVPSRVHVNTFVRTCLGATDVHVTMDTYWLMITLAVLVRFRTFSMNEKIVYITMTVFFL